MRWKTVLTSGLACTALAISACAPGPVHDAQHAGGPAPSSTPAASAPASPSPSSSPTTAASPSKKPSATPTVSSSPTVSPSAAASKESPEPTTKQPAATARTAPGDQPDCSKLKCIALTFDDGPGPHTAKLLDGLAKTNAKATFFVLGPNVNARPDLVARMAKEGHQIGNHSWSHPQFSHLSAKKVLNEVERTSAAVKKATGHGTRMVRPPYGAMNKTTRAALTEFPQGEIILWSIDTLDWKTRSTQKTIAAVKKEAKPGAIVLMHDIHKPTVEAVPAIVDYLISEGYTLVTVDDLLAPENPQPGHVFTHLG